jgi:hypothetical protein
MLVCLRCMHNLLYSTNTAVKQHILVIASSSSSSSLPPPPPHSHTHTLSDVHRYRILLDNQAFADAVVANEAHHHKLYPSDITKLSGQLE